MQMIKMYRGAARLAVAGLFLFNGVQFSKATDPWPAEADTNSIILTSLDSDFTNNMSGASWNPERRVFWICKNGGPSAFWMLEDDGAGSFQIATNGSGTQAKFDLGSGDLEGICQVDFSEDAIYLMVEGVDQIRKYDVSTYGSESLERQWNIASFVPTSGGSGSEGITFVPNEWLQREQFTNSNGVPYIATNGMGGLMFVAHQNGGRLYVFDLSPTSTVVTFVGSYRTSQSESCGLEFDRTTGLLYIWHNTGANYLEVTELSSYVNGSERQLTQLEEFYGPRSGNLEGIAMTEFNDTNRWCLIVDDNNDFGQGVMLYQQFEHTNDFDGDSLADSWELTHLTSTTNSDGSTDYDGDEVSDLHEYLAGTDPTNSTSLLQLSQITFSDGTLLEWSGVTGKFYNVEVATNLTTGFDTTLTNHVAGETLVQVTNAANADVLFYRVRVDL